MKYDGTLGEKLEPSLDADAYSADTNGQAVDCAGYEIAVVCVSFGDAAGGTVTFEVEESANGSTGWTAVSGASFVLNGATDDNTAHHGVVRCDGRERYLRVTSDHSASNAADYSACVSLRRGSIGEQAAADAAQFVV